jgi:hypothetical protein
MIEDIAREDFVKSIVRFGLSILALAFELLGFFYLLIVDWRIALGVFFILAGEAMTKRLNRGKE